MMMLRPLGTRGASVLQLALLLAPELVLQSEWVLVLVAGKTGHYSRMLRSQYSGFWRTECTRKPGSCLNQG